MSKESLEQFMKEVAASNELKARLLMSSYIDTESLITLGAEYGYSFTLEDLKQPEKYTIDDLGGVVGGLIANARANFEVIVTSNEVMRCAMERTTIGSGSYVMPPATKCV
ncbi:MAG: Nif11-like leader peptide family natural product precursor [Arenicellales bacterium]|jgi:predicted ribosomally synthesized peptide with nif11-like leader|nr:Nif11-like leader peptide family natural product precursor [Arenicellales bacterium]MDP7517896.1 Nif11-like leader peptide family natural product precursor [Arenicellales bacterium]HJP45990.1 Nif11-like leader peptide family natural product precursor [Arenicellales bacterium]|tara:strand:- start:1259 stop:1588 length:330 start_codon:yes stop_codon:yes gene_type:complete